MKNTSKKPQLIAIDDSPTLANFLKIFLQKTYDVMIYKSTSQALEDIAAGFVTPDCIVTDYYLGNDTSGLDFILQLKQIDPITPVLVLSGSCDVNERIACLENGATDFISKPFNPKELEVRIKNALGSSYFNTNHCTHAI